MLPVAAGYVWTHLDRGGRRQIHPAVWHGKSSCGSGCVRRGSSQARHRHQIQWKSPCGPCGSRCGCVRRASASRLCPHVPTVCMPTLPSSSVRCGPITAQAPRDCVRAGHGKRPPSVRPALPPIGPTAPPQHVPARGRLACSTWTAAFAQYDVALATHRRTKITELTPVTLSSGTNDTHRLR